MKIVRNAVLLPFVVVAAAACAVVGGGAPDEFNVAALHLAGSQDPASAVAEITAANANMVLLSADRDSAWFAAVAAGAGLELSGPGTTSGRGLAFMTDLEILGDTSIVLDVEGGGSVHMHDALYKIDDDRNIDLMMVRFDAPDLRAAVRTLFGYIATDVAASAAVLLAIDAVSPQAADSAAVLMRATLGSGLECAGVDAADAGASVRLLYGPSARLACLNARALAPGIFARVQVQS